jgi:L-threonylcarbamoyladenylate synthase
MTKPERIPLKTLLENPLGRDKLEKIAFDVGQGSLMVYPTETIYGLGGSFEVRGVKEKIFSIKRRNSESQLILIAPDRRFFSRVPVVFPEAAERLAREFWPGNLTLVLPSPEDVCGIGVRISSHPFIAEFFRHSGSPLFSTSANLSREPYVNDPDRIAAVFSNKVEYFIDAGQLPNSLPSTVVRIGINGKTSILREGAVPAEKVFNALR